MLTSRSRSLVYGAHGALLLTSVKLLKTIPQGYDGRLSFGGVKTIQLTITSTYTGLKLRP